MSILFILATIFGTLSGIANFPQAYKIFKRKSAKDISIITFTVFIISSIIWVLYGIEIGNFPIIMANSFGTISLLLVIIGWLMYGGSKIK